MHSGTVFYDLLNYGPKPEPVKSNITSCLKRCTVSFRFTKRVMKVIEKNTFVLASSNVRTFLAI